MKQIRFLIGSVSDADDFENQCKALDSIRCTRRLLPIELFYLSHSDISQLLLHENPTYSFPPDVLSSILTDYLKIEIGVE